MNSLLQEAMLAHRAAATNTDDDAHVFVAWKGPRAGKPLRSIRDSLGHGVPKG